MKAKQTTLLPILRENIAKLAETEDLRRETSDNLDRWAESLRALLPDQDSAEE